MDDASGDVRIERVELLINDEVVAGSAEAPFDVRVDPMPEDGHWVRARAAYNRAGREVIVESPSYKNPWWPYGGPED